MVESIAIRGVDVERLVGDGETSVRAGGSGGRLERLRERARDRGLSTAFFTGKSKLRHIVPPGSAALLAAGFTIDHSEAGLYLWCTRNEPAMRSVEWLAGRGILAAPGTFYGPAGAQHIRVALTASDERVDSAVSRLSR